MNATHRTHMGKPVAHMPRWSTRPYRMTDARRKHIHNSIRPMHEDRSAWLFKTIAFVAAAYFVGRYFL